MTNSLKEYIKNSTLTLSEQTAAAQTTLDKTAGSINVDQKNKKTKKLLIIGDSNAIPLGNIATKRGMNPAVVAKSGNTTTQIRLLLAKWLNRTNESLEDYICILHMGYNQPENVTKSTGQFKKIVDSLIEKGAKDIRVIKLKVNGNKYKTGEKLAKYKQGIIKANQFIESILRKKHYVDNGVKIVNNTSKNDGSGFHFAAGEYTKIFNSSMNVGSAKNNQAADSVKSKQPTKSDSTQQKQPGEKESLVQKAEKGKKLPFDDNNKTMARIQNKLLKHEKLVKAGLTLAKIQGNLIAYFDDAENSKTFEDSESAQAHFKSSGKLEEQTSKDEQIYGDGNYGDETKEAIKNFQRDMIQKGRLKPLKNTKGRVGFSNIDGLYGPNTHVDFLSAKKSGQLKKPATSQPKVAVVKKGSKVAKKIIRKSKASKKKAKINCGQFGRISFHEYIARMIAMGCISLNTRKGKLFIPDEKKKQCQLCVRNMAKKKKRPEKIEAGGVLKVNHYTYDPELPAYEIEILPKGEAIKVVGHRKTGKYEGPDLIYVPSALFATERRPLDLANTEMRKVPDVLLMPIYNEKGTGVGWLHKGTPYFEEQGLKWSSKPEYAEFDAPIKTVDESFSDYFSSNIILSNKADKIIEQIQIENFILQACEALDIEY